MKRPYFSVMQNSLVTNIISGIGFIILALMNLIQPHPIIVIVFAVLLLITMLSVFIGRHEATDEMARVHNFEAHNVGYIVILGTLMLMEVAELCGLTFSMFTVVNFCFGTGNLSVGYMFRKLERDGDSLC